MLVMVAAARLDAQEPIKPLQEMSVSAESVRDSIVALARAQIGRKYVWGGESPDHGFDCSGLVQYVLSALHIDVPRTARQLAKAGTPVPKDTSVLRPGDLLLFGRGKSGTASHVGIYVGDGLFVQASSAAGRVVESPLQRPVSALAKVWQSARRILTLDDSTK
ncbi:MAG TPA: C40 family peptidase [Gemmatimonadaceae bacterium]|nr:C40 family peptidase [Gemmatimonadaceae bacterium]